MIQPTYRLAPHPDFDYRRRTVFFRQSTTRLPQHLNQGHAPTGLANFAGSPSGITQKNRFVLPQFIDRGNRTERGFDLAEAIRQAQEKAGHAGTDLLVFGTLSLRAQTELKKRGIGIASANLP